LAITLPIFEGGRLRANLAGTNADYDIAVEQYNQALADALKDVVDQRFLAASNGNASSRSSARCSQEAYDLCPVAISRRHRQLPAGTERRSTIAGATKSAAGTARAPVGDRNQSGPRLGGGYDAAALATGNGALMPADDYLEYRH
jgi:hypothetical protein